MVLGRYSREAKITVCFTNGKKKDWKKRGNREASPHFRCRTFPQKSRCGNYDD